MYPVISRQALKNWSIDQQYASGALPMLINSQMSSSVHAAADHQATIQGQSVYLPAARIYAHPTRLISAWNPMPMQIHLPETLQKPPQIEITIASGVSHNPSPQSFKHRIQRVLVEPFTNHQSAPLELPETYLYDHRYDTDANIAHILTNAATRLLTTQAQFPELPPVTVVLRSKAVPMARRAYELLGIPVLCTDRAVQGQLVSVSESSQGAYEWNYGQLFGQHCFSGYSPDTPERVFIARKGDRSLLNEADVEALLAQYGFVKFYYEDIPLQQQWSISKNAKVVVGIHGAALSSLVFNTNRVKLLELFHPGYVVDMYRNLVVAVGGTWTGVIGQLHPEVVRELDFKQQARSFARARARIDLDCLRMGLENLEIE